MANGIPDRVDRVKSLGNAVVPQQFYIFFKLMADIENGVIVDERNELQKPMRLRGVAGRGNGEGKERAEGFLASEVYKVRPGDSEVHEAGGRFDGLEPEKG